ncbi:hypothetical protein VDG1235_4372 [Verrucomicrobiia bacterium DG1235]|nr:hypothetical protein VDG1235_4372 [Verrucomicrobiae bacterium DG1235]
MELIYPAFDESNPVPTQRSHFASTWSLPASGQPDQRYPDAVEVFIRVLDNRGARLLSELEDGSGSGAFEDIVANHSRLFRRFVIVREGT